MGYQKQARFQFKVALLYKLSSTGIHDMMIDSYIMHYDNRNDENSRSSESLAF